MKKNIIINPEDEKFISQRADKFLAEKFPEIPRAFFQAEIKKGGVLINGEKTKPSYKLKKGDWLKIDCRREPKEIKLIPQERIPFKVVFRHQDFLVIEKPAGISVHPSLKEPKNTLVNGLIKKFPQIKNVGEDKLRPGIVHRLDKETAGLMIIALNQKAFDFFKSSFKNKKIQKKYLALVWGEMKNKQGKISGYIGKSKTNPTKQSFSQNKDKIANPKKSLSYYKIIQYKKDKTLLEVETRTGRMHQIRVHLHSLGHPIVGDKKYANKFVREKNKKYQFHQLVAYYLKFEYLDGEKYEFKKE